MAETVFVTGASGQLGLPLVRELVSRGHRVVGMVRSQAREAAVREAGAAEVLVGSLDDSAVLEQGMADATVVYHLAGGIRREGALDADRINRAGTETVAEAARKAGGRLRAFVYASSSAVYGNRQGLWVDESYAPSPNTKYGEAKVAAENVLLAHFRERALPVVVARIGPVYGPGLRFTMDGPIKAGKAWLPGEGLNIVSVVHVDDVVDALIVLAERGKAGEIYHVAGRTHPLLKEFYAEVHKRVGGTPVRFWSTYVPSALQLKLARVNERVQARLGRRPRFTEDNLKLIPSGVRLRTERLEKELAFQWKYPDYKAGLDAFLGAHG